MSAAFLLALFSLLGFMAQLAFNGLMVFWHWQEMKRLAVDEKRMDFDERRLAADEARLTKDEDEMHGRTDN